MLFKKNNCLVEAILYLPFQFHFNDSILTTLKF